MTILHRRVALIVLALILPAHGHAAPACPPAQPVPSLSVALPPPPLTIFAIGSSSTRGLGSSAPEHAYPAQLQVLLQKHHGPTRVENAGRNGERAASALERLRDRLADNPPDLVIWQTGINSALTPSVTEAAFAATLEAGLTVARRAGVPLVFLDGQAYPGIPNLARYTRFMGLIAATGAPVFPRYAIMQAWDEPTQLSMLARDRFHLNDRGYACMAQLLAAALRSSMDRASGPGHGG